MMRDELLQRIAAVPPGTDIGVRIGDDQLDIVDLVPWGDGRFVALRCLPNDLEDVLKERARIRRRVRRSGGGPGPLNQPGCLR